MYIEGRVRRIVRDPRRTVIMNIIFFTGKGGVGKSTNAAVFSVRMAGEGKKVLLNSIDPAHNLHDIFNRKFKQKPVTLLPGLHVMETDLDHWVKKYLRQTKDAFKESYRYMEALNLHKYFSILKYSPGIEEYAVLLALEDTIRNNPTMDYIVFDTPPTALTLRFLSLPKVSLLWLRELLSFRKKIMEKKEIVTKIKRGEKTLVKDPVMKRIEDLIERYTTLESQLYNHSMTSVIVVLNNDPLSLSESKDIYRELRELGMNIPRIVLNKFNGDTRYPQILIETFAGAGIDVFPSLSGELTGLDRISATPYPIPFESWEAK